MASPEMWPNSVNMKNKITTLFTNAMASGKMKGVRRGERNGVGFSVNKGFSQLLL